MLGSALLAVVTAGCASYQTKVEQARRDLVRDPAAAIKIFEPLAKEEGKDQLVYLLDYATALQVAGQYDESVKNFLAAERLSELKDYHSISRVAGSLLLSEDVVQYKGDDFEKVLINGMNAMNFLELGQLDSALVEVRRLNEKLYKLKLDGKNEFNQSPLAFYLSAMIWEADKKFDDAYIAYADAYKVAPHYRPLREDLVRAAIRAQRDDEVEKWQKAFPEVKVKPEWKDRTRGEIAVVFLRGWGPRKYPRPEAPRFPKLISIFSAIGNAEIAVLPRSPAAINPELTTPKPAPKPVATAISDPLYSVDEVAIKALDEDYARLVASRVVGIAAKAVVADQIRQKNELLGAVAWVAMNVADQADLRQWSTLPQSFQVARVPVPAGHYTVQLRANGTAATMSRDVSVPKGGKAFVVWRVIE